MTPFARTLALGLPLAVSCGLYAGHITTATAHNIANAQIARTTLPEDPTPAALHTPEGVEPTPRWHKNYSIDAYEDGSGVLYEGNQEIWTFDEGFLPWDCTDNGNSICGPNAPAEVRGYKCAEYFYTRDDAVIRYCTDGTVYDRAGDDVDAEGETIG